MIQILSKTTKPKPRCIRFADMKVAIVKYNAGNVQSLTFALNRLGVDPVLTDDADTLATADKVIFPGQGEASSAMRSLLKTNLPDVLRHLQQPFLGVCLGMQLMFDRTAENDTICLGIVPGVVRGFGQVNVKVPHMGWNQIHDKKGMLFEGVNNGSHLYFVHSYFAPVNEYTIATCDYDGAFSAAIQKNNFYAIQPHPEKSAEAGMKVLENFLNI